MARKDWITAAVNTKGLQCPIAIRECPGHRTGPQGCAFWLDENVRNASGDADMIGGCVHVWSYVMAHEVTDECKRTQVAVAQAANAVHGSVLGLAKVAALAKGGAPHGVLHSG